MGLDTYSAFISAYFAFFGILLVINADLFFGPDSIIMMAYFEDYSVGPALFFGKALGITILHLCAAPYVFGVPKEAMAKVWLSANICNVILFAYTIMYIPGATSLWYIQAAAQAPILLWNYCVIKDLPKGGAMF